MAVTASRFLLAAWVGAAVLFVVNSIREQRSPAFTSQIRDELALIRFPAYYVFGFGLVGAAAVCCVASGRRLGASRTRRYLCLGFTFAALAVMAIDFVFVYRPLVEMITPPGSVRSASFHSYHIASKRINEVHITLAILAAVFACWPVGDSEREIAASE